MRKILIVFSEEHEAPPITPGLLSKIRDEGICGDVKALGFESDKELEAYINGVTDALGWKSAAYMTTAQRIDKIMQEYAKEKTDRGGGG